MIFGAILPTPPDPAPRPPLAAGLLGGGEGRRLGGVDKALLLLDGEPLATRVARRLIAATADGSPEGGPEGFRLPLAFSVHCAEEQHRALAGLLGLTLVEDPPGPRIGPLGGLGALLRWARSVGADTLLTLPVDTPFFPDDLPGRLAAALAAHPDAGAAVACWRERQHNALALWRVGHGTEELVARTCASGSASLNRVLTGASAVAVAFDHHGPPDPFLNLNSDADLADARERARR